MDERDEVEQQQFQARQSTMKKDKKNSKTENKFKSKLESLKRLPHTTSATSAFEKARAFLRSLDFKYHNRHEQPSPTNITIDLPSSNEDNQKKDILLNPITPITNISTTTRITRVEKINPQDLIVHRIIDNEQQNESLNYFQQKYKQYLKPSLLIPKQYYNDLINKRNQNYSIYINRHDFYPRSNISTLSPNLTYSNAYKEISSHHFQPFVCRDIGYHQYSPSSSMLTWNQCVRRLNKEYRLTIDALQQAKECLEKYYLNSKYTNENKSLLNNETKKHVNVTFCLPLPSINRIEQNKTLPAIKFSRPKLVKPVELNTFLPSTNLEPQLSIIENDEKQDSIANIIKKFNDLSSSLSTIDKEQSVLDSQIIHNELKEIPEETTYTVETIYKNPVDNKNELLSSNNQKIIIIQENTTEEQFNLAYQEMKTNPISSLINTSSSALLNNNKINSCSISLKNNNKSTSQIPKRIATNVSRVKRSPVKTITNAKVQWQISNQKNNLVQSSSTIKKQPLIDTNHVKSMVHQINTTTSSNNKRPSRPIPIQRTTITNKNTIQRK